MKGEDKEWERWMVGGGGTMWDTGHGREGLGGLCLEAGAV